MHINSGRLGVEFILDKTILDFNKGAKKIHLDWAHSFEEFKNVLEGQYKLAWKQVIYDHFPDPVDLAMAPSSKIAHWKRIFVVRLSFFSKRLFTKRSPGTGNTSTLLSRRQLQRPKGIGNKAH